jgi:hypothetical protein
METEQALVICDIAFVYLASAVLLLVVMMSHCSRPLFAADPPHDKNSSTVEPTD